MQSNTLSYGSVLHGNQYNYIIEKVLGQGSFGITYLASVKMQGALGSIDAKVKVAVKEFFMKEINGREGTTVTSGSKGGLFADYRKKFVREATNLSKLQHPNIIKVLECFEANNTVYYTMEYLEDGSLDELISRKHGLSEAEAVRFARQIANALSYMHEHKVLHLDLKPGNIMLNNGNAMLIDFGLSKQYDAGGNPESSTTVGAGTPGYAPIEQSNYRDGKGFPVTMDIYALGATMYKMLTGQRPPNASEVLNDGLPDKPASVSSEVWAAVIAAMEPMHKNRPQTVEKWLTLLSGSIYNIINNNPLSEDTAIVEENIKPLLAGSVKKLFSKNGHQWVDLGLSVKWATCNVGAEKPEEIGDYYGWGKRRKYSWIHFLFFSGYIRHDITGKRFHDVARNCWGSPWRIPTKAEWEELSSHCTFTWKMHGKVGGFKVTSRINGNSIFLPCGGWRIWTDYEPSCNTLYYWSSTPENFKNAYQVYAYGYSLEPVQQLVILIGGRYYGSLIRPVFSSQE